MDEIKVPIYLMTGFLESGKTSFLSFTIQQDYFHTDGKTLLILCEEGEEEYNRQTGCHGYSSSAGACYHRI